METNWKNDEVSKKKEKKKEEEVWRYKLVLKNWFRFQGVSLTSKQAVLTSSIHETFQVLNVVANWPILLSSSCPRPSGWFVDGNCQDGEDDMSLSQIHFGYFISTEDKWSAMWYFAVKSLDLYLSPKRRRKNHLKRTIYMISIKIQSRSMPVRRPRVILNLYSETAGVNITRAFFKVSWDTQHTRGLERFQAPTLSLFNFQAFFLWNGDMFVYFRKLDWLNIRTVRQEINSNSNHPLETQFEWIRRRYRTNG